MSSDSVTLTRCAYCDTVIHPKRSTMKFCDNGQKCKTAFNRAKPEEKQLEGSTLLSVRARQQQKDIERAQIDARKAERISKKAQRDKLKAENVRLGIEQALAIKASNREVAARYSQQAQDDLNNGILGIKIAAQDKWEERT